MKNLFYKEMKLAMHPVVWIFMFAFPLLILIPNYPLFITFIYTCASYPILFLGANKGQQSNDLLYSTLLPVRKKDIVLARLITVTIIQVVSIILCSCLVPLSQLIKSNIASQGGTGAEAPGLTLDGYLSIIGIILTGFALSDLIFFPIYYKKGKSIVFSSIMTILFFSIYIIEKRFHRVIFHIFQAGSNTPTTINEPSGVGNVERHVRSTIMESS